MDTAAIVKGLATQGAASAHAPPPAAPDADRSARIEAFVHRHFTWPGTLHLHRAAVGFDILRAPVNVLLSPVLVLVRLLAWVCGKLRLTRPARWLQRRRLLLRTAVSARVEAAILTELLGVPLANGDAVPDRAALGRAILAAPHLREAIRQRGSVAGAQAMADRITGALGDYTGTRSAMAEFTVALLTLAVGGVVFQALTPGMMSMAPGVAEAVSHGAAVSGFPLGETLGGVWYGVFPVGPSPALVAGVLAGLMVLGAVVAAFAGILADPVQTRLGLHRRRLMRLFATIDAETAGATGKDFVAHEHLLARVFDLMDTVLSVFRAFRG